MSETIIIGSGIAGISAGYHLEKKGEKVVIYEKDNDWGGLCGNFTIDGFRFDRFVHFTFTEDEYIKGIFEKSSPLYDHPSVSSNYYKGYWLKHPAQNNLAPLSTDEKVKIISSSAFHNTGFTGKLVLPAGIEIIESDALIIAAAFASISDVSSVKLTSIEGI